MRRVVADKRDAVDEILRAFLHPHRDVDDRRARPRFGRLGRQRRGRLGLGGVGVVARFEIGIAGELEVSSRPVHFAGLFEPLANGFLAVILTRFQVEHRLQRLGPHDRVTGEAEVADLVPFALGHRNAQLDKPSLLVRRITKHLELRHADVGFEVPVIAIVRQHLFRVFVELDLLIRAAAADEGQEPLLLVLFHLALERARANRLVAEEGNSPDLDLRALVDMEGQVHELGPTGHLLDLVGHLRVLKAFFLHHLAHDRFDLLHEAGIDERVEADLRHHFLQLLVDLRGLELLRTDVVDDLHALPLLHVVSDHLADDAVRERVVGDLNPEVVQEVRVPQAPEVFADRVLGRVVVRHPHAFRGPALLQLDVIEVRFRVDDRRTALSFEARGDEVDEGAGVGRRQRPRRRDWLAANRRGSGGRRLAGRLLRPEGRGRHQHH